ncbi:DUF2971 domain-containing protein [Pseudoalteromonas piscicida]|uniref:DUF2971 domain-containing protein n=1 Tax=Pseudoalteromonas piscicida TaxID=43662 RepID=UPI003C7A6176
MNRFLYKYMPLRASFFDEPMIRATPALELNDPFECRFNDDQIKDADRNHREYCREKGKDVYDIDDYMLNDLAVTIQDGFTELGIISFTEDYNNPLMWAHYADEHRGLVVEFDFNKPFFMDSVTELNGRSSRFGESCLGDVFEFPEKVNYRREMPDFSRVELSTPDDMNEFHLKKFIRTILFTKSNDWIYEKEQRSVVRLIDADSIICKDNEHVRKECQKDPSIRLLELDDGRIQVIYPPEYEMHEDMGDQSIKDEIYFLSFKFCEPAVYLFRINPEAISGVYFGYKSDYREALEKIKKNKSLSLFNQRFKMEINSHLYQLDKVKLEE